MIDRLLNGSFKAHSYIAFFRPPCVRSYTSNWSTVSLLGLEPRETNDLECMLFALNRNAFRMTSVCKNSMTSDTKPLCLTIFIRMMQIWWESARSPYLCIWSQWSFKLAGSGPSQYCSIQLAGWGNKNVHLPQNTSAWLQKCCVAL